MPERLHLLSGVVAIPGSLSAASAVRMKHNLLGSFGCRLLSYCSPLHSLALFLYLSFHSGCRDDAELFSGMVLSTLVSCSCFSNAAMSFSLRCRSCIDSRFLLLSAFGLLYSVLIRGYESV